MKILVTGGAGFIGSNFVRWVFSKGDEIYGKHRIIVLDKLTYAGNLANLAGLEKEHDFRFVRGDICDETAVTKVLDEEKPDAVINFAAETHVDRSIVSPLEFVKTNVEGTQVLLHVCRKIGIQKYVQISTDEVYGSLGPTGRFSETTPLDPSSAYSASKTGADLLVLAAHRTHGFPACVTRCSNNYGPYQFPEKLIPFFVTSALEDKPLPLYGDGKNVRSWLHVDDHSRAIRMVLEHGKPGEVYNVGGSPDDEKENIEVTRIVLKILGKPETLVKFVEDRHGHDRRYAVDYSKIEREFGWRPEVTFEDGIRSTVDWYVQNKQWWQAIKTGDYLRFYEQYYTDRLRG